jgi:hypothetical protein
MESFQIVTSLSEKEQEVLVIPEDCEEHSIFHVVKDGAEYCKLLYTEQNEWQILNDASIKPEELQDLTAKIEDHIL